MDHFKSERYTDEELKVKAECVLRWTEENDPVMQFFWMQLYQACARNRIPFDPMEGVKRLAAREL